MFLASCSTSDKEDVPSENVKTSIKPLYILHTNDVHCYIDKTLGYASVSQMKKDLENKGYNVLLVDVGDYLQGAVYSVIDSGRSMVRLMEQSDYDIATIGNHETDFGMQHLLDIIENTSLPIVSCNIWNTDASGNKTTLITKPYKIFDFTDYKVAVVGITTPETKGGNPLFFVDENNNPKYSFSEKGDTELYDDVQNAVDNAISEGAGYVIALGHLGIDEYSGKWTSYNVIANTRGIDAFIDGHSHSVVSMSTTDVNNISKYAKVANLHGDSIPLAQTGCYFSHVGLVTMDSTGRFTTSLYDDYPSKDATVENENTRIVTDVDNLLSKQVAEADIEFVIYDENGKRLIRTDNTNLGRLVSDAFYYYANCISNIDCDVAIVNGGGIRTTVEAGMWSYKSCKSVMPFQNTFSIITCTGKTIKEVLEWCSRATPTEEMGAFAQVAGLTYEIDTTIVSTVQETSDGTWGGSPTGEYRVKNIKIYDKEKDSFEDLNESKVYRVCGTDYSLTDGGDGLSMFQADDTYSVIETGIGIDYICIANYLLAFTDDDGNDIPNIKSDCSPLKSLYKSYPLNYEYKYNDSSRIKFK